MRPELLELKNFGPFCGEHSMDFSSLGDFFLICGENGAGKTTLFDAISYAFYGKAPGGRKGYTEHLRSHYADESEESYVQLTFSIGDSRWRIRRALPGKAVGKNKKSDEISLERERDGVWEHVSGKKKETSDKIIELVGLSADEFSRIVLLPQGEFAQFLKQDGEDRRETLSKLFPVSSIYESAAEKIKNESSSAEAVAKEKRGQMDNMLKAFNPETFEAERQSLEENVAKLENEGKGLQQEISDARLRLDKAERIASKRKQLKAAEDSYQKEIEGRKDDYGEWQKRLDAANRAAHIEGFINARKTAFASLDAARAKLKETAALLEKTEKEIALHEAARSKAEKANADIKLLAARKPLVEGAVAAAEEHEENGARIASLNARQAAKEKEKASIEAEIAQAEAAIKGKEDACSSDVLVGLTQARAEASRACEVTQEKAARTKKHLAQKAELDALREKESRAKEEAAAKAAEQKEAEAELEQARAALAEEERRQKAAALALSLEEGAPCPVCGSVHHPAPAKASGESLDRLRQQLEAAKQKKAEADNSLQEAKDRAVRAEGDLENRLSRIEETEEEDAVFASGEEANAALAAAEEKAAKAEQALKNAQAALKEVTGLKASVEALRKRLEDADKAMQATKLNLADLQARRDAALKRFNDVFPSQVPSRAAAAKALAECEARQSALEQFVKGFNQKDDSLKSQKATLEGSKNGLADSVESLAAKAASAETELKEKCAAAGFASHEEAEAAALAQGQKAELSNKIESFKARKSELESQKDVLRRDIAAETADAPPDDSKELSAKLAALESAEQENKKLWNDASVKLSVLEENRKRWLELEKECEEAERDWAALSGLSNDLQGNNSRGIKFETWILQQYLEEIVEYANLRIARLSTGQYELRTGDSFSTAKTNKGLGLEIFDSYTGTTRPVAMLSGGETFLVSISLALGLSDSIQNRKGGIQLESIFIDEGFGSLDNEHVDLAMNVFNEIRDHRMIGIVSHLDDLKERIPEKLEVKKNPFGGSELHVNLLAN